MIEDIDSIHALLDEMSSVIDMHLDLFLIGGGAMMFMGSKEYTKDLDFVVSSTEEYRAAIRALESL